MLFLNYCNNKKDLANAKIKVKSVNEIKRQF